MNSNNINSILLEVLKTQENCHVSEHFFPSHHVEVNTYELQL